MEAKPGELRRLPRRAGGPVVQISRLTTKLKSLDFPAEILFCFTTFVMTEDAKFQ
jgi:hypothetical protein